MINSFVQFDQKPMQRPAFADKFTAMAVVGFCSCSG